MKHAWLERRLVTDDGIGGVNIVPVIDLCLVLLVILLVVSPMLDEPPVKVTLPKARTTEEKANNIAITLDPAGNIALNTDPVDRADLPRFLKVLLKEQGRDVLVILRSDRDVAYGDLTDLLKTVKDAGAANISLGTEQAKEASN
jgi:biopolymer transport protein ExbD